MAAEDSTNHPLEKLRNNLALWKQKGETEKQLCVLLSTGSLNPVHLGHVLSFETAKAHLENQENLVILAGFLSPSDAGWCSRKTYGCYSNEFRLQMVQAALEESDWISADGWEVNQERMVDFPEVAKHLANHLATEFPEENIRVLYLCGADHASKCGLWRGRSDYGVAVMKRPGYRGGVPGRKYQVYSIDIGFGFDASSTQVRKAIVENNLDSVQNKLHPSVLQLLKSTSEQLRRN